MPGYMQGSKRARHTPSISNQTSIFGIMGGLAPRTGNMNSGIYRHILIKAGRGLPQLYGKTPGQQQQYLKQHNLLSRNPLTSGGVGARTLMFR
tara:strand:+ start:7688 stop:7966 length:279 start_codon:yes stop_codon:yes gene_type:complete